MRANMLCERLIDTNVTMSDVWQTGSPDMPVRSTVVTHVCKVLLDLKGLAVAFEAAAGGTCVVVWHWGYRVEPQGGGGAHSRRPHHTITHDLQIRAAQQPPAVAPQASAPPRTAGSASALRDKNAPTAKNARTAKNVQGVKSTPGVKTP